MHQYFKEKPLLALLSVFVVLTAISDYPRAQQLDLLESTFWYLASLGHVVAVLSFLRYFSNGETKTKDGDIKKIGFFGYIWRYVVTFFSALMPYVILAILNPIFSIYPIMIVIITIFFGVFSFLYFCKNKQQEILKIKGLLIGLKI